MKKRIQPVSFVEYHLRRCVRPGDLILDVGCGPAPYRLSTSGRYVGLDITDEPYGEGFPRDVDLVASASAIPEPDAKYDLVFSVASFYQLPDPGQALNEFYRVLKPGGRLILFDYNRRTQKRLQAAEGQARPCWTQWGLKRLVARAGFLRCELLVPVAREVNLMEKWLRMIHQELLGHWAIVTGVKSE